VWDRAGPSSLHGGRPGRLLIRWGDDRSARFRHSWSRVDFLAAAAAVTERISWSTGHPIRAASQHRRAGQGRPATLERESPNGRLLLGLAGRAAGPDDFEPRGGRTSGRAAGSFERSSRSCRVLEGKGGLRPRAGWSGEPPADPSSAVRSDSSSSPPRRESTPERLDAGGRDPGGVQRRPGPAPRGAWEARAARGEPGAPWPSLLKRVARGEPRSAGPRRDSPDYYAWLGDLRRAGSSHGSAAQREATPSRATSAAVRARRAATRIILLPGCRRTRGAGRSAQPGAVLCKPEPAPGHQ